MTATVHNVWRSEAYHIPTGKVYRRALRGADPLDAMLRLTEGTPASAYIERVTEMGMTYLRTHSDSLIVVVYEDIQTP